MGLSNINPLFFKINALNEEITESADKSMDDRL